MKKAFAFVLILILATVPALAEDIDLSTLSFDELLQLQQRINDEIVSRPEWKETIVPAGIWTVGVDIPSGSYSISVADSAGAYIHVEDPNQFTSIVNQGITSQSNAIGKVKLQDGFIVTIKHGSLKFAPAVSLGF